MSENVKSSENNSQGGQQIIINQIAEKKSNGVGTAGFVLALIAFCIGWIPIIGWVPGWILWILGLILSFAGVFKKPRGLAITGLIISVAEFFILFFVIGAMVAGIAAVGKTLDETTKVNTKPAIENTIQRDSKQAESSSTKNEDFKSFIQTFVSDKNFQFSRIKFPLSTVKSKNEWELLDANDIFDGVKRENGYEYEGTFSKESNNEYVYRLIIPEVETICTIFFSKINGEWMLTDFYSGYDE